MKNILFYILMFVSLSACKQDIQAEHSHQLADGHKHESANFIGKPHAPVSMNYDYLNNPKLNESLEIKLEFKVKQDVEQLQVNYQAPEHLKLVGIVQPVIFSKLAKDSTETLIINVTPELIGRYYINISATIIVDGVSQSRSFAVPVEIGSSNQLKTEKKIQHNGMRYLPEQNVISMPATETTE